LAVQRLRRDLECLATGNRFERSRSMAVTRDELRRELEELIAALDRREARVEHVGEAAIARDAAALRAKATVRLTELANQPAGQDPRNRDDLT
jgi:hypothetical protein